MLKTIPFNHFSDEILLKANPNHPIEALRAFYNPKETQEGVVVCRGGIRFLVQEGVSYSDISMLFCKDGVPKEGHELHLLNAKETHKLFEEYSREEDRLQNYGVCDNAEQVIEKYKLRESELQFTVSLSPIRKNEQPERDGWRWRKWGEYIGEQNPRADYLFDEPEIEMVYTYLVVIWN